MRFLICLFLFCSTSCFAQNKVSDEELLNAIYKPFIFNFPQYNLASQQSKFFVFDTIRLGKELGNYISDSLLRQMLSMINPDSVYKFWDCTKLDKAICLNAYSIDTLQSLGYTIVLEKRWTKRRKEKERLAQIKRQDEIRANRSPFQECVFYFSQPLFSKNHEFALIRVEKCGGSCTYLYKNSNGIWKNLSKAECIVF